MKKSLLRWFPFLLLSVGVAHSGNAVSLAEAIQPRTGEGRWDYSSYYFTGAQMESAGTSRERVVEVRRIDGVTAFRVEFLSDWRTLSERLLGTPLDPESFSYFWEYYDEEGSYNFFEDFDNPQPPTSLADFSLTLPYPTQKGHQYQADGADYEVIAIDREVTVPAGTFQTVVYEITEQYSDDPMDKDRQRFFMAPGVGLVRWEMDVPNEDGRWVLDSRDDLFSFSLRDNV
jgi:hypothetical protein